MTMAQPIILFTINLIPQEICQKSQKSFGQVIKLPMGQRGAQRWCSENLICPSIHY